MQVVYVSKEKLYVYFCFKQMKLELFHEDHNMLLFSFLFIIKIPRHSNNNDIILPTYYWLTKL